jgi:hypothetical protein
MTSMFNTPDSPAKTPGGYTTQGGNFWTLITPEIWKVLHAVLQLGQRRHQFGQPSLSLQVGLHVAHGNVADEADSGGSREALIDAGPDRLIQVGPVFTRVRVVPGAGIQLDGSPSMLICTDGSSSPNRSTPVSSSI